MPAGTMVVMTAKDKESGQCSAEMGAALGLVRMAKRRGLALTARAGRPAARPRRQRPGTTGHTMGKPALNPSATTSSDRSSVRLVIIQTVTWIRSTPRNRASSIDLCPVQAAAHAGCPAFLSMRDRQPA